MTQQVLVVGAGPVGLTMAAELARYGVNVRIIDQTAVPGDKSKALVVWSRTLELMDRAGCAEAFVAAGMKAAGTSFFGDGRRLGRVALRGIASPYPFALLLPQSETERLLEAHLAGLGVRVERRTELLALQDDEDAVSVTLRRADGGQETARVAWLAGCDGAHSTVRHRLALPFQGKTLASDWLLADLHLSGLDVAPDELAMFLHKDGVLAVFPMGGGRYRIIADQPASGDPHPPAPSLADMQAVVARRGPGGVWLERPVWLSGFRINERMVAGYRAGRVFLAGDAAHVHSPAGGQGMNTGMQDAFNLAWKLALVCRGTCAPALLESYAAERRPVAAAVLAASGRLTAMATLKNPLGRRGRNLAAGIALRLPAVRRALAAALSETEIGYPDSGLNQRTGGRRGGPRPGQRVVVPGLPPGAGDRPRFTLFSAVTDATIRRLRDQEDLLDVAVRPPLRPGAAHLVRPDGHVGLVAGAGDADAVVRYLDGLRR